MCGICGFIAGSDRPENLAAMTQALAHRGPDDRGGVILPAGGDSGAARFVGLGHRRLSVIDLSRDGRQPMRSADGRVSVVFNGEIYNYRELRHELLAAGYAFTSRTDTEVLVHGWSHWGEELFDRVNGMYAVAIWDGMMGELFLTRDRLGIKPLYLYRDDKRLLFASELRGLCAHPDYPRRVDSEALALLLEFSYVPAPHSIYANTRKVLPGERIRWRNGRVDARVAWTPRPPESPSPGAGLTAPRSPREVAARCDRLVRDAVSRRLVADVPVGTFLSGGIDSTLVTATAQRCANRSIDTFCIGFDEPEFNEAPWARAIADHLGTHHHELTVTPAEALGAIETLSRVYDEPLGDPSALPTYLVSRFARASGITVALSGDGGDELFCGYPRYTTTSRLHRIASLPAPLRRTGIALASCAPSARLRMAARNASFPSLAALYHHRMSTWKTGVASALVRLDRSDGATGPESVHAEGLDGTAYAENRRRRESAARALVESSRFYSLFDTYENVETANLLSLVDIHTYLADDILAKVDRASMAVALEVRVPLLDHRLVEFAVSLPSSAKTRRGRGKLPLRELAGRHVPARLLDRPKRGFGIPVERWLRGPLRSRLEQALDADRIAADGLLDPADTRDLLRNFLSGTVRCPRLMWSLLMFQTWLEANESQPRPETQEDVAHGVVTPDRLHADPQLHAAGRRV